MKYRMLTNATPASPIQLGDRSYTRTPGTVADIPTIDAGRLGANGYLQLFASFASTLPAIPGHMEREEVTFSMTDDIEAEFAASLSSLGGAGAAEAAQRQRIEAAANEADRAMRVAMAAVGAS